MDFDTFFAGSCADMLARALVLSGNRHDAEDAVQEAYAAAWAVWDRIRTYDNPGAWVYKVVRQRLWKSAKRWRRLRPLDTAGFAEFRTDDGDPERFAEAAATLDAMGKLPDRQRMVLAMYCLGQMEQRQIAEELGLTRGAVAASIFKARRKLEKALGMTDTELGALESQRPSVVAVVARGQDPLVVALRAVVSWLAAAQRGRPGVARPGRRPRA